MYVFKINVPLNPENKEGNRKQVDKKRIAKTECLARGTKLFSPSHNHFFLTLQFPIPCPSTTFHLFSNALRPSTHPRTSVRCVLFTM